MDTSSLDGLVDDIFTYHQWDKEKIEKGNTIRDILKEAYKIILIVVPDCPDRDAALRKLRECRMDCNSAITHQGKY